MWIEKLPFVRVIRNFDETYLVRFTLFRSKRFTLYLHIFHQPDPGRDLHNHPWDWCWSLGLWGGYLERIGTPHGSGYMTQWSIQRYAMCPRVFDGSTYHSIEKLSRKRVVTLFAHGQTVREWGFWRKGKHVPWHKYLVEEGINTAEEIEALKARYSNE